MSKLLQRVKFLLPTLAGLATGVAMAADSININFFFDGNTALSDSDTTPLGADGYKIPCNIWDNQLGQNGTLETVHRYDGSNTTTIEGASVTVSGTRGPWRCSKLTSGTNILAGYIDDNDDNKTPTVTITGIPFDYYKVLIYHACDTGNIKFGLDEINGIGFSAYENKTVIADSPEAPWGSTGAQDDAEPFGEGVNYLITPVLANNSEKTLTIVSHFKSKTTFRSCIAAISIVEAEGPAEIREVEITSPFDGSTLTAPGHADKYAQSAENVSFGNNPAFFQYVNNRQSVVANVTGGEYTAIHGFLNPAETTSNTNKDVYLVISGATAKRAIGVQEAHWSGNTRRTRTEGDAIVQIEDGSTIAYAIGAGYKGGRMPTAVDGDGDGGANAQVQGNTGVTVKGGNVTGSVIGGWTAAHRGTPTVTGNSAVRIETVLPTATAENDDGSLIGGYVVGGNYYQANSDTATSVGGNSSVTLALEEKSGEFDRYIVGGSLLRGETATSGAQAVTGNSSVNITASNDVTFPNWIVGGGAHLSNAASGRVTVGGNASVTINGGTYTGTIVAGGYKSNDTKTSSVGGKATLTLNSGVFTSATLKGGSANGGAELVVNNDLDISNAMVQDFTQITVTGGGKVTIADTEVANLKSVAIMDANGQIVVSGSTATSLTLVGDTSAASQNYMNNGTLDLTDCSSLTELIIELGNATTFDLSHVALPVSCTSVVASGTLGGSRNCPNYSITGAGEGVTVTYGTFACTETREEFGKGNFKVTGVPEGATISVTRPDGTTTTATATDGTATIDGNTARIAGAATMYDATFTNTTSLAYKYNSGAGIGTDNADAPIYNNELNDTTTGIFLRHHPYTTSIGREFSSLGDFTAVVVGQMSPTRKTQFIHMGASNANSGILIATTENADEVIIAPNTGSVVDTSPTSSVKVTVPNAASTRHAYVIIRSGNTFAVWVDGVKRGNFSVPSDFMLGSATSSGIQVGSDFGGQIKNSTDVNKFQSVPNSPNETGVVNAIRVFDYIISDAQKDAVFETYPYVSQGGLYTRTIIEDADLSAQGAWSKTGDEGTFDIPEGATVDETFYNPSVTITADASATLTVNANLTIDKITIESGNASTLTIASDGSHAIGVSDAAIINSPFVVKYGALNLAGTPVTLGASGTLAFDFASLDFTALSAAPTIIQLTGLVDRADDKVSVIAPAGTESTFTLSYNALGYYEVIIMPVAKIVTESATSFYGTVADALDAFGSDSGMLTLYAPAATVTLNAGQSLEFGDGGSATSVIAAENCVLGMVNDVYTAYAGNTPETWIGEADANWSAASNWSLGFVPAATTPVKFNDGAAVTLDDGTEVAGITINGAVSISSSAKYLNSSADIAGDGTLTLNDVCLGSAKAEGITVAGNVAVDFTNDSELARSTEGYLGITFNGDVTVSGAFKVWDAAHTVNGALTINSGVTVTFGGSSMLNVNGPATINGAITRSNSTDNCTFRFLNSVTIKDGSVTIDGWKEGNLGPAATVVLAGENARLTDTRGTKIDISKVSTTLTGYKVQYASNVYSLVEDTGFDPSSGASETDVQYDNSNGYTGDELIAQIVAATSFKVPEGASVEEDTYKSYFTYSVTEKSEGVYTLAITGLSKENVVGPVDANALNALCNCMQDTSIATGGDVTVTVMPGLYYAFVTGSDVTALGDGTLSLATGETMTFAKPNDGPENYIKIRISAKP